MRKAVLILGMIFSAPLLTQCANQNVGKTVSASGLNSVYFDFDQAFIRQDQIAVIQGNAAYLKKSSGTVVIEGNCDERGTNEYNLALGQRRADSTRNYLSNLGVNSSMMRTVSYGEERPVCTESSESCWMRNRRADFKR